MLVKFQEKLSVLYFIDDPLTQLFRVTNIIQLGLVDYGTSQICLHASMYMSMPKMQQIIVITPWK